ncbi:ribosome biogenesis GTP-binding protein YihA/YsxC [Oenococcus alcoholitolerans]|uniref:ribosome biogenesis GTP-binding protein YihA/YsxC n=1 Tax=Oenococcus alcoholitolerans TaxID=931074 RepID=UPI003F724EB1
MIINDANLVISAVSKKQYPNDGLPEIAFVGRSNVGKSSLINTILDRKNLAHTSGQPGKTQTLNFYRLDKKLFFVDVPGYGFAKVSKKKREEFGQMVEEYLSSRPLLKGVVSLIDARHQPTADDKLMYDWLNYYQIPLIVVATKADKIARGKFNAAESEIKKFLKFKSENDFLFFSAVEKTGVDELWQWILQKADLK